MEGKWIQKLGTPLFSRIAAYITSDSHLQNKQWRGLTSFYSKRIAAIKDINKKFKSLFGIEGRVYTKQNKNLQYKIFFISKPLAEFLEKCEIPEGNKVNKPFFIASWVLNGNREVHAAYLRGLFTGEGSVFPTRQKKEIQGGEQALKCTKL